MYLHGIQQLNFINLLPGAFSDWSDCIILTHKNIRDNSDLPIHPILLVSFYHEDIVDIDFHWFCLWLRLCLSLRAAKYSWNFLFQAASLHLCTYLGRFFQLSLNSSSSGKSSGNLISLPRIIEFVANNEYSKSSSAYLNGQSFRFITTSNNTSSNSDHVNNNLIMDFNKTLLCNSYKTLILCFPPWCPW